MKSSMRRVAVAENIKLPEKLTAEGIVRLARALWRDSKRDGDPPHLFSLAIEASSFRGILKKTGQSPAYFTGGALTGIGRIATCESILSAFEGTGRPVDPRVVSALDALRSVMVDTAMIARAQSGAQGGTP